MTLLFLGQMVLSALVLARRADVDLMAYDAWDRAYLHDKDLLAKFEKTYSCCGFASLYDRAVPHDCTENDEFGFIFPCHDRMSGPLKAGLKTIGSVGLVLAAVEAAVLILSFILYSDFATTYGEGLRLGETRRLMHEGSIPATQYATATSGGGGSSGSR